MTFYPVVNDLIGGYDVSEWDKPVSQHDTRPEGGEYTIGTFMTEEWATRVAVALNAFEVIADRLNSRGVPIEEWPTEWLNDL